MIKKTFWVILSSILMVSTIVGCSNSDTNQKTALQQNADNSGVTTALNEQKLLNELNTDKTQVQPNVSRDITKKGYSPNKNYGSLWNSELFNESRFQLNIKLNASEKKEARILARSFESHMERSKLFMYYLLSELKERNLPIELAAIPLVESGFNPRAKSHAGARGPWQFTRNTGKSYGLEVNANYDEFYDFIESTQASLAYLEHLYNALGHDWELALAGYNQGEFGVKKAIRKAKHNGVKNINSQTVPLSKGARTYIKRFRAYADIFHHPEKYGLEHPAIENRIAFKRVKIGGRLSSMQEAAKLSGVDLKILKHLNAGYLSDSLTSNKQRGLLVPVENVARLERALGINDHLTIPEERLTAGL